MNTSHQVVEIWQFVRLLRMKLSRFMVLTKFSNCEDMIEVGFDVISSNIFSEAWKLMIIVRIWSGDFDVWMSLINFEDFNFSLLALLFNCFIEFFAMRIPEFVMCLSSIFSFDDQSAWTKNDFRNLVLRSGMSIKFHAIFESSARNFY
jgi:hypothetical protein